MNKTTEHELTTLPHEREFAQIVQTAFEAYQKDNVTILIITDSREHGRYITQRLAAAVEWDGAKIYRDGIEVKGGGKVLVRCADDPGMLMGLNPDKIFLMGRVGEFFYWLNTMQCEIQAVA